MHRQLVFLAVNASYSHSSLAAASLQAACADLPWNWQTVEVTAAEAPDTVAARIAALRPVVLAATLYLFNREYVLDVVRRLRARHAAFTCVLGGPECLGTNEPLVRADGGRDIVVRGEGEYALRQFLGDFDEPVRWPRIHGFCGLVDGRYVDRGRAEEADPLDELPSPFGAHVPAADKPFTLIETARGCGNRCAFCTSGLPGGTRYLSLPRVRQALATIRARGVREVRFADRTFNQDPDRCVALLRMLREEFPETRFHLEIDPALLVRPILAELDRARPGQLHLEAGVQSLAREVYRRIGRRAGVGRTLAGLRELCARPQVEVHADLMAGLPGQTLSGLMEDVRTLVALVPHEIQLEVLKVLPGTALDREREAHGLRAQPAPPYRVLETREMSAADLDTAAVLGRALDLFYNTRPLRAAVAAGGAALPTFWPEFVAFVGDALAPGVGVSLEARFRSLHTFLAPRATEAAHRVAYAWLRHGMSARRGLVPAQPWHGPVPADAVAVDGVEPVRASRQYRVELDQPYLFVYGPDPAGKGRAVRVYRLSGDSDR